MFSLRSHLSRAIRATARRLAEFCGKGASGEPLLQFGSRNRSQRTSGEKPMRIHEMKTARCNLCEQNTALVDFVVVKTLAGKRKRVAVKRCGKCDTTKCHACGSRTLKVNQSNCDCGAPLIPKGL